VSISIGNLLNLLESRPLSTTLGVQVYTKTSSANTLYQIS